MRPGGRSSGSSGRRPGPGSSASGLHPLPNVGANVGPFPQGGGPTSGRAEDLIRVLSNISQLALAQLRQPRQRSAPVIPALHRGKCAQQTFSEAACSPLPASNVLEFQSCHFANSLTQKVCLLNLTTLSV